MIRPALFPRLGPAVNVLAQIGLVAALLVHSLPGASLAAVTAVPLPDFASAGFHFPESEATITNWIAEMDRGATPAIALTAFQEIHQHGWGLWTALTAETDQVRGDQALRVFETWPTPQQVADMSVVPSAALALAVPRERAPLQELHQFDSGRGERRASLTLTPAETDRVIGFVKFDPTAAAHLQQQSLLTTSALNQLLVGGAKQVPSFPSTALALKCVFQVIKQRDLVNGRYYLLKAWSGPPAVPQAWPASKWPGSVWIDLLGGGAGQGDIDLVSAQNGSSREDRFTYPLSQFMHYQLTASDAAAMNEDQATTVFRPGDQAILVAMHVAGREIARWTWQTFWWTPAPDQPPAPSSAAVAQLRPDQLTGAPRHYAMSLGYSLLSPDQPQVGGSNSGRAVYAYNPWLEAKFGPADLPDSQAGLDPSGHPSANNTGVQSNCMSCHLRANYNPQHLATAPRYSGARYVDLDEPQFVGALQVDFLWSIPANAR